MTVIVRFLRKYEFPLHLVVGFDRVRWWISRLASTLRLKLILRTVGCRYGKGLIADGRVIIRVGRKGAIEIGDNVTFRSRFTGNLAGLTNPVVLQCLGEGRISIGNNCGFSGTVISARSTIRIGNFSLFGVNTRIYDHDFHSTDPAKRRLPQEDQKNIKAAAITIGDDVFVGANAIILKGCTIGDRSTIGAGAVLAKMCVPPDSLVVGNPGKIVQNYSPGRKDLRR
ncbi:MAG: acyltransferase [Candidatus Hadarchaeum sp.]